MEKYKISPNFNSKLTSIIFELESIRNRFLMGDTPPWLFYDLKNTLHLLESLNSARIEGNHTTLLEVMNEATRDKNRITDNNKATADNDDAKVVDELTEILNIQEAIRFIEENLQEGDKITANFIRELHATVVKGLKRDGSSTPGVFRTKDVRISKSKCVVSSPQAINGDIIGLIDYINDEHEEKEDIIRIACAHHRFAQIHPFDNGNGRTARLITYAMLVKYGFLKKKKTILNPSSVFCMDRGKYYEMLGLADTGLADNIEKWCEYVAEGILEEMKKMFKLLDRDFAVKNLIIPAIKESKNDGHLSEKEYQILMIATEKNIIQAADVVGLFGVTPSDKVKCSRFLAEMVEKGLLLRPPQISKKYVLRFFNKNLLSYVIKKMDENRMINEG